jgi:hypothetical protein
LESNLPAGELEMRCSKRWRAA